jgi:hypothetical protein
MNARTDKAELAERLARFTVTNTLAAERDKAIMQRDKAVRENKGLQTQLRMALKERDEARALGRTA